MLQYPINFYPDGNTIDPSGTLAQRKMSFTFKGDVLLGYFWRVYNYDTEALVDSDYVYNQSASALDYNGADISYDAFANTTTFPVDDEHRYVVQLCLTQGTSSSNLIHDRFVLRGEITDDYAYSTDTTKIMIEDKINLIYEWNIPQSNIRVPMTINQGGVITLGSIVMKIGNEERTIVAYNYNTGEVTLDSALTADYSKGTPYQLYSNYLITQQYFFKTAPTPSITNVQAKWAGSEGSLQMAGVRITANYTLNEYNPLKYYTITMEKQVGDDVDNQARHYYKIYETDKIYSQRITATFTDDYDIQMGQDIGNSNTRRYLFTIKGVLQNGMTISAQIESQAPARQEYDAISNVTVNCGNIDGHFNVAKITWSHDQSFALDGGVRIYRYDMNSNDVLHDRVLLASAYASDDEFIDETFSTHGNYKYLLVPFSRTGEYMGECYTPVLSSELVANLYGYTITELIQSAGNLSVNNKPTYKLGESWHLRAEIDDTTITQNTDRVLHVGYGKYSSVTHTATNYMSSTFTGSLVQPDCSGVTKWRDDIGLVKAWRDFITRDTIYLLRSQKGDVWVVNIVDSPTTTYEEGTPQISTSVSFNWAECASIDDIMVVSGNVW